MNWRCLRMTREPSQDETRLCLKTRESKVITALGVKPKGFVQ